MRVKKVWRVCMTKIVTGGKALRGMSLRRAMLCSSFMAHALLYKKRDKRVKTFSLPTHLRERRWRLEEQHSCECVLVHLSYFPSYPTTLLGAGQ